MVLEVEQVSEELFAASCSPPDSDKEWGTREPLNEFNVRTELRNAGVPERDLLEAIEAARTDFKRGRSEIVRHFREIQRRAASGVETDTDIDEVIAQLESGGSDVDRAFLIGILDIGHRRRNESMALLVSLMKSTTDPNVALASLKAMANLSPGRFAEIVLPFLDGLSWDVDGRVRAWAFAYSAAVVRKVRIDTLLQKIAAIARERDNDPLARRDARIALAAIGGLDRTVGLSDDEGTLNYLLDHAGLSIT